MGFGDYPVEYDPAKHGPYNPSRYYGTPDTKFFDLKLKDIPAWFSRREKTPQKVAELASRAYWRWQWKYTLPKKSGIAPFFQIAVSGMIISYIINYRRIRGHRNYKYH
ncbi:hypothetical protein KM043_018753 [Ampulex compressa]|nr:hypothetical protein KM043_018753 [Ampulex compressa]